MKKEIELKIPPRFINDYQFLHNTAANILKLNSLEISAVQTIRRSIDARSKNPVYRLKVVVYINEQPNDSKQIINYKIVNNKSKRVGVVGFGPAGMFASLRLLELGIQPIIFERGKDVQSRRKDLRLIQQDGIVNSDSNYCFGEGGAGTYSDGKLYTRSTKRGDVGKILSVLVQHGAQNEILIDAHPHIGSNILPKVVSNIRGTILQFGGEIHFNSKVTDFLIKDNSIYGVVVNNEREYHTDALILAVGHSARDIFYLLNSKKIKLETKPFAIGVRIEHPQALIDEIQYHSKVRDQNLPASNYTLACQVDGSGVYSFCMCPGGIIIPASTSQEELVLNGMSISRRNSPFANSGLVVSINENDWKEFNNDGIFAGLEFQKKIEKLAFDAGGKSLRAPAQRVTDFVDEKISYSLPKSSYIPGIVSSPIHEIFPSNISKMLQKSLLIFNKKMKGYFTEEAQILAAETRTSSPIRITRNNESLEHIQIKGLFPCGEGAGYAGGIVSAAVDGERCAEAVLRNFKS
jgi:uncharacterized FAD-dependent dehydrogenase